MFTIFHADKIQILTLTPSHWTVVNTMDFFGATKYSVGQARELVKRGGVMSRPEPRKKRTGIPEEIKQNVKLYYQNGEYVRELPGKKDKKAQSGAKSLNKSVSCCALSKNSINIT